MGEFRIDVSLEPNKGKRSYKMYSAGSGRGGWSLNMGLCVSTLHHRLPLPGGGGVQTRVGSHTSHSPNVFLT